MSLKRTVYCKCPVCGEEHPVQARGYRVDTCLADVIQYPGETELCIDWDTLDLDADFVYECPHCQEKLAADMDDLLSKVKSDPEHFYLD